MAESLRGRERKEMGVNQKIRDTGNMDQADYRKRKEFVEAEIDTMSRLPGGDDEFERKLRNYFLELEKLERTLKQYRKKGYIYDVASEKARKKRIIVEKKAEVVAVSPADGSQAEAIEAPKTYKHDNRTIIKVTGKDGKSKVFECYEDAAIMADVTPTYLRDKFHKTDKFTTRLGFLFEMVQRRTYLFKRKEDSPSDAKLIVAINNFTGEKLQPMPITELSAVLHLSVHTLYKQLKHLYKKEPEWRLETI